ncbi:MAG: flippase-like domain-containing protein [Ardenticatenales bacterium]|nr:flippase-like domain-containing protein [Ardenticatenales bacterium]
MTTLTTLKRYLASPYLRLGVGTALTLLTLYILVREVDLQVVGRLLVQAERGAVLVALLTVLVNVLGKAARWRVLLGPAGKQIPFGQTLSVLLIGQMLNTLLPIRVGDLTRAHLIGSRGPGRSFTMGTIILEKASDLLCYALLFLLLLLWIPLPSWVQAQLPSMFLLSFAVLACLLLALYFGGNRVGLQAAERWLPASLRAAGEQGLRGALSSLDILRRRDDTLKIALWSSLIWMMAILTNYFVLQSLHLDGSPVSALFVLLVLQLGITIPSVPGTIGIFEYLCVLTLALFAVESSAALSFGILLHALVLLPTLIGLILFWTLGLALPPSSEPDVASLPQ